MMPEAVSRLGAKWYAATNEGCLASILRCIVKTQNFDGYGEVYDRMRMVEPKAEEDILCCFTRTSSHAARQHLENVGALVARLFVQTNDLDWSTSNSSCSELKARRRARHGAQCLPESQGHGLVLAVSSHA